MPTSLTLTASSISALSRRADVVAAFPFFRSPKPKKGCCGKGGGKSVDARRIAKNVLALTPARREVLKRLLGVDRVVVVTVKAARQEEEVF